jgi:hypothetical protein
VDGVDGVEHVAGVGEGFGVGIDFLGEGGPGGVEVVFVGLAEAGPGVGEAGELVGGVVAFADAADRVKEQSADEKVAAEMGGGAVGGGGGDGELIDVFQEAEGLVAVGVFLAPLLEVGVVPAGEGDAEVADEARFVGDGAGPDEGIGVAGFEVEGGDIAVGCLGEEPVADLFVLPAVVEFAIEFVAEGLGEQGEAASRLTRRFWVSGFRVRGWRGAFHDPSISGGGPVRRAGLGLWVLGEYSGCIVLCTIHVIGKG